MGETPLPHSIINRPVEPEDSERFQSIFARNEGAVTAPTASLHFSRELMKRMEIKGIDFAYITLHAGLGNFRDIDVEDLTKHKTDSEQMIVTEEDVYKRQEHAPFVPVSARHGCRYAGMVPCVGKERTQQLHDLRIP